MTYARYPTLNFFYLGGSIETKIGEVAVVQEVFHNGHDLGHLEENKDAVAGGTQLGKRPIKQLKLARDPEQQVVGYVLWVD